MRIVIQPSANGDPAEGFDCYERQGEGLGNYFLESLCSDIDSLRLYAGIHRVVYGYHRLLSHRFPYAVNYSMEPDTVFVRAVLDCRRDPKWLKRKLQ